MVGAASASPPRPAAHLAWPCRKLAYNRGLAASINNGLAKMNEAKADISRMKVGRVAVGSASWGPAVHCHNIEPTAEPLHPASSRMHSSFLVRLPIQSRSSPIPPTPPTSPSPLQGDLAVKNQELAVATHEAEKLLREISDSTAVAEKEKQKVAVIVEAVSKKVRRARGGGGRAAAGRSILFRSLAFAALECRRPACSQDHSGTVPCLHCTYCAHQFPFKGRAPCRPRRSPR